MYRVVVKLRESAGATATISSIDLTFMSGSSAVASMHADRPISDAANVVPANSTVDSRELVIVDDNPAHAYATSVRAVVTFSDGTSTSGSATGVADVPPLAEPAPSPTPTPTPTPTPSPTPTPTPSPSPSSCTYTIAPSDVHVTFSGGQGTVSITRTAGTCSWQATSGVPWITLTNPAGSGSGTLAYTVAHNATFEGRAGSITVTWTGGTAQLLVRQDPESPAFCIRTVTVGGQSSIAVPAAGGQFTANVAAIAGVPPGACGFWTANAGAPITIVGPNTGPTGSGLRFNVPPNPSPQPRTMFIDVSGGGSPAAARLTVNQSGT
jgi:hypothetical protein